MAAKKKAKKKTPAKKNRAVKVTPKKSAKKKASPKKVAAKRPPKPVAKSSNAPKKPATSIRKMANSSFSGPRKAPAPAGDADSQGLSEVERADSESVSELLEEGNTFEAGVVAGVERADDADEREIRTREVPEDDVPEEYLDKD